MIISVNRGSAFYPCPSPRSHQPLRHAADPGYREETLDPVYYRFPSSHSHQPFRHAADPGNREKPGRHHAE